MASSQEKSKSVWTIENKVALITGANTGIGYHTALELARRGAKRILLACRNENLGKGAIESIKETLTKENQAAASTVQLEFVELDLASLASVRQCAARLLQKEGELHVLICNAGVHAPNDQRHLTGDGFEMTFQVNHLGHFLLVNLLLPLLKRSQPARIVVVASQAHQFCFPRGLDIEDLNCEQPGKYDALRQYNHSKLCNILFARKLNEKLNGKPSESSADQSGVACFSLHPGFVKTTIARRNQSRTFLAFLEPIQACFAMSPERGADCQVYCACQPGLEDTLSGCYFSSSKPVSERSLWKIAKDDEKAQRLWELSEQMVGGLSQP